MLTESLYLLGPSVRAQCAGIEFVLKGGATLIHQSPASLARATALMMKYKETPMDFADATLVVLAEETGIEEIFTLDLRGFQIYRICGRKSFIIRP